MNANRLLEKLAEWTPEGEGRHSWSFADGDWAVHLTADRNDSLASRVWEMAVVRTGDAPGRSLRAWADSITASASGLMEDLKVIEIDPERNEAQLRSDAPSRRGPVASFYEVTLHGTDKAMVRRFQADITAGTPRTQIPFAVTHEVLAKLAEDIAR